MFACCQLVRLAYLAEMSCAIPWVPCATCQALSLSAGLLGALVSHPYLPLPTLPQLPAMILSYHAWLQVTLFATGGLSPPCSRMRGSKIQAIPIRVQDGHQGRALKSQTTLCEQRTGTSRAEHTKPHWMQHSSCETVRTAQQLTSPTHDTALTWSV